MGKGDKKSKRGKINNGSYGKSRLRKASTPMVLPRQVEEKIKTEKPKPAKAKVEKPVAEKKETATKTKKTEE